MQAFVSDSFIILAPLLKCLLNKYTLQICIFKHETSYLFG
jgi:hypothetical protein